MRRLRGAALCLCTVALLTIGTSCGQTTRVGDLQLLPGEPAEGPLDIVDHRQAEHLRFLVLGDSGTGKRDQWMVAEGMADRCEKHGGCDFALLLGDAIYPSGVDPTVMTETGPRHDRKFAERFEKPYALFGRLDMWIVPGNHDWRSPGSVSTQIAYSRHSPRWRMPGFHYVVPKLPDWIHLYGLDTTPIEEGEDDNQVEAARNSLCGGDGWRLIFGHHPVFTSGKYANSSGAIEIMRRQLVAPMIDACDIHVYFAGHEHHQEHLRAPTFDQVIQGAAAEVRSARRVPRRGHGVQPLTPPLKELGFAMVDAWPDRLELRFFGCDRSDGCEEIHCQAYNRADFDDPRTRSSTCEPADQPSARNP